MRHALAEMLGLPENRIRVVAPDVGGGFGVKAVLYPEEVALCACWRMRLRPPGEVGGAAARGLRSPPCTRATTTTRRGPASTATAGLLALDARIACNAGAYSGFPWTAGIEALMAGGLLTGPYKVAHYAARWRRWRRTPRRPGRTAASRARPPPSPWSGCSIWAARALGLDRSAVRRPTSSGPRTSRTPRATRLVARLPGTTGSASRRPSTGRFGYAGLSRRAGAAARGGPARSASASPATTS